MDSVFPNEDRMVDQGIFEIVVLEVTHNLTFLPLDQYQDVSEILMIEQAVIYMRAVKTFRIPSKQDAVIKILLFPLQKNPDLTAIT